MSLLSGIHVFYGNSSRKLQWLYSNGRSFSMTQPAHPDGLPDLDRGASAVVWENHVWIYCTCVDNGIHQVMMTWDENSNSASFRYMGRLAGVDTQDECATVVRDGSIHYFYRQRSDGSLKHVSQAPGGIWNTHRDVKSGSPGISYGPAAVLRGTGINVVYCESGSNRLKCVWLDGSDAVNDLSPPVPLPNGKTIGLHSTPAACLLGNDIFVFHRSNGGNDLFCAINDQNLTWTEQQLDNYIIYNGPGACVYGDKIYLLTQGTYNNLYCQMYIGRKWVPPIIQVTLPKPIDDLWWSPAAVAVA